MAQFLAGALRATPVEPWPRNGVVRFPAQQVVPTPALGSLINVQKLRDRSLAQHSTRVGEFAALIGREMGFEANAAAALKVAAGLHDVGKVAVPDAILRKPGPLTPDEWAVMKTHPTTGYEAFRDEADPVLALAGTLALLHHEACDGSGYPFGLSRHEIPIEARIVSICDVYDALREDRPYRSGFDHGRACDIIQKGDGRSTPQKFDADVLSAFGRASRSFERIFADAAMSAPAG